MKIKEKLYSYYKPDVSYDEIGEKDEKFIEQKSIRVWLTQKSIFKMVDLDIIGLEYDFIGITKDLRPEKNDLINNYRVVYTMLVDKWLYIFLQDYKGEDDESRS